MNRFHRFIPRTEISILMGSEKLFGQNLCSKILLNCHLNILTRVSLLGSIVYTFQARSIIVLHMEAHLCFTFPKITIVPSTEKHNTREAQLCFPFHTKHYCAFVTCRSRHEIHVKELLCFTRKHYRAFHTKCYMCFTLMIDKKKKKRKN